MNFICFCGKTLVFEELNLCLKFKLLSLDLNFWRKSFSFPLKFFYFFLRKNIFFFETFLVLLQPTFYWCGVSFWWYGSSYVLFWRLGLEIFKEWGSIPIWVKLLSKFLFFNTFSNVVKGFQVYLNGKWDCFDRKTD